MSFYMETIDYRSPFADNRSKSSGIHHAWCYWREQYANDGNPVDLDRMLEKVTLDNPPDAPKEPVVSAREIRQGYLDILPYIVILVLGPLFGLLLGGWLSAVALIAVLAVIFGFSAINELLDR